MFARRPPIKDQAIWRRLPPVNAGGFDVGDFGIGHGESVYEDLGDESWLKVDLEDRLGEGGVTRPWAESLDHVGQYDRPSTSAERDGQRHCRNDDQPQTDVEQSVGEPAPRRVRDMSSGLTIDGSILVGADSG